MANQQLEIARRDLLDLSARNRLINTRRSGSRSSRLEIVDELSDQVFGMLVQDGKPFSFLSNSKESTDVAGEVKAASQFEEVDYDSISFAQPDEELEEGEVPDRHKDNKLQTTLDSERLQKKLLKLFYDARTFEEEQGVNTLYLAIGFVKWFEDEKSKIQRQSPLILVPVQLERKSVGTRFSVRWDEGEIATNLSLQAKLKHMFGIELPDIPESEEFLPSEYFAQVRKAIEIKKDWEIVPNAMVIWFFSFAKFLMYKDMEPERWPEGKKMSDHELVSSLVGSGFGEDPPICGEDDFIDDFLQPIDMVHVVPADSSQAIAIEEAKRGRNLVIQGPPGTGKSQTITNIIAAAVETGKKVLFVSEKMAALQVVKQRLDEIDLGELCLELHSNKSNKKAVLQEIEKTLLLGQPKTDGIELNATELRSLRDTLNRHAKDMHTRLPESEVTPYQVLGELVRLKSEGIGLPQFKLEKPEKWPRQQYRENLASLKDLEVHLKQIGDPSQHCWRGATVASILPSDVERIKGQVEQSIQGVKALVDAATKITSSFDLQAPASFQDIVVAGNHSRHICKFPEGADKNRLSAGVWKQISTLNELVSVGAKLKADTQALDGVVSDVAWDTDMSIVRRHIKAYGKSWFRFFNRRYKDAKSTLEGVMLDALPNSSSEQLLIVDRVIAVQQARKKFIDFEGMGKSAFGELWAGENSSWENLAEVIRWQEKATEQNLPAAFVDKLSTARPKDLTEQVGRIKKLLNPTMSIVKGVTDALQFDLNAGFETSSLKSVSLSALLARLEAWRENAESLSHWTGFRSRLNALPKRGMQELANVVLNGEVDTETLVPQFEQVYYESLIRLAYVKHPDLAKFSGASHDKALEKFKRLDSERYLLARQQVAAAHYDSLPRSSGDVGEVGTLKREFKKKRRHMPIRKLLASAGHAVQAIKPVFMMSPISIAQFLEPGVLDFDILLIDEASQVKPVDAIGAIARSRQIVVVGDERQLPPTNFFDNVVSDEDETDDADVLNTSDIESVLGLCSAQSMNERMLKWHYRSRHHSLISVSNQEFYQDRLFIVPSPNGISDTLGLSFVHVKDGVFDRGKSATNRVEARKVADAVIDHARACPDKTLGVGTFSVAQRDAILNELELRRLENPELAAFFAAGKNEPFFVKNLENIQGDERDVIFISIGYARDAAGKDSMNFGPVGKPGGERRLNVLITRAKERCAVFSSITSDYIDLNRTKGKGTAALKTYLQYAETGTIDVATESDRGFDSEFERQVAKELESLGFDVRSQIGDAGFFVDLAIVDPENPGRFLIGIECDGATYHSSRSARDRDKIRQSILEDRGWIIHRIWSTDWFQRPEEQLKHAQEAIEAAKIEWGIRDAGPTEAVVNVPSSRSAEPEDTWELSRDAQKELPKSEKIESTPYEEAWFPCPTDLEIHELPPDQLGTVIKSILAVEAPIHRSEIARRVSHIWGLARTGTRIVDAVNDSIDYLNRDNRIEVSDSFCSLPGKVVVVRNREAVASANLKKPEQIPPAEITAALEEVIKANIGIESEDAMREVGRLLGFRSTSAKLKDAIAPVMKTLCETHGFEIRQGRIYVT